MKTEYEDLVFTLERIRFDTVRKAFIHRSRQETERITDARTWMTDNGYTEYSGDAQYLTEDGREIITAHNKKWVLDEVVWNERKADLIEKAKKDMAEKYTTDKIVYTTEEKSSALCPECNDVMVEYSVCPSCAFGKLGFTKKLVCSCGVELYKRSV